MSKEEKITYFLMVKKIVDPLLVRLEKLDANIIGNNKISNPIYYRNEDLKKKVWIVQ